MKKIQRIFLVIFMASMVMSCGSAFDDMYDDVDSWRFVGNPYFSDGEAAYVSLAFNGDVPYVAFQDRANSNKATVMKLNGDTWEVVGTKGFSDGAVYYVSMVIINGIPYVGYMNGGTGYPTVMKFDGSSWVVVGTAGFGTTTATCLSMVDYNGVPCVAVTDSYSAVGSIRVYYYNGSWTALGNTSSNYTSAYSSLKLAVYNNTPYLAYCDNSNSGKASVIAYNGTAWSAVGTAGFSAEAAYHIDMAINEGVPYVVYTDKTWRGNVIAMKYSGSAWEKIGSQYVYTAVLNEAAFAIGFYKGEPLVMAYLFTDDHGQSPSGSVIWDGSAWRALGYANIEAGNSSIANINNEPYVAFTSYNEDPGINRKVTVVKYGKKSR